jgi:Predicted transcriptional regulators
VKLDQKKLTACAEMLAAMGEPTRLAILYFLGVDSPKNVSEVAKFVGMDMVNASHHLRVLKNAGLVTSQKNGRFVEYKINEDVAEEDPLETTFFTGMAKVVI